MASFKCRLIFVILFGVTACLLFILQRVKYNSDAISEHVFRRAPFLQML